MSQSSMGHIQAPVEVPPYAFLSIDALETGMETFTSTLISGNCAWQVCRLHEIVKHFPFPRNIVSENRRMTRC